jgi:hypothetical protein
VQLRCSTHITLGSTLTHTRQRLALLIRQHACLMLLLHPVRAQPHHVCVCVWRSRVQVEAALRTALQLRKYDDILDPGLVYAFLALVGFYSSFYGTCSKVRGLCWCCRVTAGGAPCCAPTQKCC